MITLSAWGVILDIIEAKRLTLGPQNVLTQTERCAFGLTDNPFNFRGLRVPFLYSTNSEVIWHHDIRHPLNLSRQIVTFHAPDALLERVQAQSDETVTKFFEVPDNSLM